MAITKLETACQEFKAHLFLQVVKELQSPEFKLELNRGLKGLSSLTVDKLNKLRQYSQKPTLSTSDVEDIIQHIVRRDAPAEFAKNNTKISDALERYRVITDLLANVNNPNGFKRIFRENEYIIKKIRDPETDKFLRTLNPTPSQAFYKPAPDLQFDDVIPQQTRKFKNG